MGNMDMITFDDVRRIIRNAHVFDYIRSLLADGHKMLTVDDMGGLKIGSFVKYMLEVVTLFSKLIIYNFFHIW